MRIWNRPPKLIGFHCLVCGFALPAKDSRPVPAPLCAGSTARTSKTARSGRQHAPTRMKALFIH